MKAQPDADEVARLDRLAGYPSGAFAALHASPRQLRKRWWLRQRIASAVQEFPGYATLALLYQQQIALPDRAMRRAALSRILDAAKANPVVVSISMRH